MTKYRARRPQSLKHDGDLDAIVATHKADAGTYIGLLTVSNEVEHVPVILWGVHVDCSLSPITMDGVWHGADQLREWVRYPDGRCANEFMSCDTEDAGVKFLLSEKS